MTRQKAAGNTWWRVGSLAGWRSAFLGSASTATAPEGSTLEKSGGGTYSADLCDLLTVLEGVRRRILANRVFSSWTVWLTWTFLGLITVAAFSRQLKYALISAATIAAVGLIALSARGWFRRPSEYHCAREVDRASGLSDRLSTALYFGTVESSDPMILRQRRDAVGRVDWLNPQALFPVHLPDFANRTIMLALIAIVLLAYRSRYNPPMLDLLHRVASSQVEKSVVSPLTEAMKKEFRALVDRDETDVKEAAADAEVVPGLADPKSADDASQLGDKDGAAPGDMQDDSEASTAGSEGDAGDPQAGNASQSQGQNANQAENTPQNQQMADANQPTSGENGDKSSSTQPQESGKASSSGSVMQALKNLMKNMTGQPTASDSNGQSSAAGASQQPGSSSGQGESKNDSPKDSSEQKEQGSSSSSQKPGGGAGNGSIPVPKQGGKDSLPPPKNLSPDRVNLEANNFRQQGRARMASAAGTAQLPLRDIRPQPVAAIKGSEQENIPVRYRLYVQRYFEHSDKAPE